MSSCTAALEIAVASLRLPQGARVGVPTWTFVASASSVVHRGTVPVLLDVDEDTLNISPRAVEAAIAEGLDALMVVHFAGTPVDPAVLELAREADIPVIEDAAHALGATDERGPISGVGTVGACYSFYATKNLTSAEGGALATHDDELARYARSQRLHGLSNDAWDRYKVGGTSVYDVVEPGYKANLPDVLATLARSQLRRFDEMQSRRRELVTRYRAGVAGINGCEVVPRVADDRSADHLFVVLLPEGVERGKVVASLAEAGIGTGVHFRPLHTFSWFRQHAPVGPTGVETADRLADRALSLPLHAGLTDQEADRVLDALGSALS
jgi:dTDP-4-amino-4,6-dideoxygalactose transaminase